MEYLQYYEIIEEASDAIQEVLNLIINGIPSIRKLYKLLQYFSYCFKPYYKWNTFNTLKSIYSHPICQEF